VAMKRVNYSSPCHVSVGEYAGGGGTSSRSSSLCRLGIGGERVGGGGMRFGEVVVDDECGGDDTGILWDKVEERMDDTGLADGSGFDIGVKY